MGKLTGENGAWIAVLICVVLSTIVDSISTEYWRKQNWILFALIVVLSPCVFFSFGYVGHRFGLSIASSLTNSLIVLGPVIVGLLVFAEWKRMTTPLYLGIMFILIGITIIVIYRQNN